ncbi:MAG: tRNA (adenosine(37)-N6)-threonylcarbamoyltransferase complex dimerization subunit type 1 TsaB [Bacteroidales bacterium]|nr:tRNA (adenosine(37)-N6)-threonylcarbamoyltransferase complex dimerization subunit type 1 TsaB [Bacteroidales bacterium]
MSKLLFIETSTSLCSTALAEDGRIVAVRRSSEPRAHASMTAVFVKEMMDEAGWAAPDAVCVSMGPGSYTGLRVGVSTAKGLCFGWKVPLIAVSTLDILARQAIEAGLPEGCAGILPMVDARRMEVYTAIYSPAGERLTDISPVVLDANSFSDLFASGPVVVIGDAAEKASSVLCHSGRSKGTFVQCNPEASAMLAPAMAKYEKKEFEDVAYFEPFYLKQFIATTPKRLF